MKRKNVLNGKYFVMTQPLAALKPTDPREKIIPGRIVGEAAEGWFLADLLDSELDPMTQTLMSVEELKGAEFFDELGELGNRIHTMKGLLSRLNSIPKVNEFGFKPE